MEAYLEFFKEVLSGGTVYTFVVDGDYPSQTMGKGGLVRTFLFWSLEDRARRYRETTGQFEGCEIIHIPLDEFCTSTLDSLVGRSHIVTVGLNDPGGAGSTSYHRGIDGLRNYLDHYRLQKDGRAPMAGFWGSHESSS